MDTGKHLDLAMKQIDLFAAMGSPQEDAYDGEDNADERDADLQRREEEEVEGFHATHHAQETGEASTWADLTAGIPIVPSPETTPTSELPEFRVLLQRIYIHHPR